MDLMGLPFQVVLCVDSPLWSPGKHVDKLDKPISATPHPRNLSGQMVTLKWIPRANWLRDSVENEKNVSVRKGDVDAYYLEDHPSS